MVNAIKKIILPIMELLKYKKNKPLPAFYVVTLSLFVLCLSFFHEISFAIPKLFNFCTVRSVILFLYNSWGSFSWFAKTSYFNIYKILSYAFFQFLIVSFFNLNFWLSWNIFWNKEWDRDSALVYLMAGQLSQ